MKYSIRSRMVAAVLSFMLCFPAGHSLAAEDSGGVNSERATVALLEGVRDFFTDLDEYQRLKTDEAKVKYILDKGSERIIQKSGDLAWDRLKSEMAKLAAAKMRAALFREQIPAMMHKVIVENISTGAAWAAANADLASKIDTRINGLQTALAGAKVALQGLIEWRKTGDVRKGFEAFGKAAADEILEYLLPPWKLFRLAQAIMEALCTYVVGYAFDTALQTKVNTILPFSPQSNPKAFMEWILSVNISSYVNQEWDEQLAYSGWYLKHDGDTSTGEEGGDAMKKAIIASLEKMKADVLAEQAKLEQIQKEFDEKIRDLELKSEEANRQALAVLDGVFSKADPFLKKIEDYKANLYGNAKKDAQDAISQAEQGMSAIPTSVAYSPVNAGSILSDLEAAFSEIREDYVSGYDFKKGKELWNHYLATRQQALKENNKQFEDLRVRLSKATGNEMNTLSKAYHHEWPKKQQKDLEALAAKERLVTLEASERCRKMVEGLKAEFKEMREDWDAALARYTEEEEQLSEKIQTVLTHPDLYASPGSSLPDNPPDINRTPEDVLTQIEAWRAYKREIEKDASLASGLRSQHRNSVKNLEGQYQALKSRFEGVVQAQYREVSMSGGNTERWTAYMHVNWLGAAPFEALQALRSEESAVSVYIHVHPWEYLEEADAAEEGYKARIKKISENLGDLELLERPASLASAYWKFLEAPELMKYEAEALRRIDMERLGHMKDGVWAATVNPAESDGFRFVEQMKKDWALNEARIGEAKKVRDAYLASGKARFKYADPTQDKLLDQYLQIPDKIAEYEKQLEAEGLKFKTAREAAKQNLKVMRENFEKLKRELRDAIPSTPLLEKLEDYRKRTISSIKNTSIQVPDAVTEIEGMKEIETELDNMIEDCKSRMGSGSGGGSGLGGGPGSAGGAAGGMSRGVPALAEFYKLYDARINTRDVSQASGEVVVTDADLLQGAIEITARLGTLDRVQTLLVSEDDGRTWSEIAPAQNISYVISPMPEKLYQFVLKIKTTDSQEAMLPFFPNIQGVIYRKIDHAQLVTETVTRIAEAYEAQNIAKFDQCVARDYIGNRVFLVEGVRFDFDMFVNTRLVIFVNRIEIRGDQFVAETKWDKTQTPRKTGLEQRTSGKTTMIFKLEDGQMKIQNLRGNLIYATLSPEIAESSGLSPSVVEQIRIAHQERNPVQPGAGETENPGGVSSSDIKTDTFTQVQNAQGAGIANWIQDFSFTDYNVHFLGAGEFGPTYDVRRQEGWMAVKSGNGIVDMGAVGINSVTEAPLSGYVTQTGAIEGNTYAIKLSDGTYALIQSTAWDPPSPPNLPWRTTFRYRHQRNGTRFFK